MKISRLTVLITIATGLFLGVGGWITFHYISEPYQWNEFDIDKLARRGKCQEIERALSQKKAPLVAVVWGLSQVETECSKRLLKRLSARLDEPLHKVVLIEYLSKTKHQDGNFILEALSKDTDLEVRSRAIAVIHPPTEQKGNEQK